RWRRGFSFCVKSSVSVAGVGDRLEELWPAGCEGFGVDVESGGLSGGGGNG
ncbi:MAG: hypothetical protein RL215_1473, partial [Planctomycetota bacterium]